MVSGRSYHTKGQQGARERGGNKVLPRDEVRPSEDAAGNTQQLRTVHLEALHYTNKNTYSY